jgi:PKD domain
VAATTVPKKASCADGAGGDGGEIGIGGAVRKRVVGVAAGICLTLGLPGLALAIPAWRAASPLSQPGAEFADTAMGSEGGVAVTWLLPSAGHLVAQVAMRAPFGGFSPAVAVSPVGEIRAPQVAVDASGDATVVWYGSVGSNFLVETATVTDGMPSTPVALSETGENAILPTVAVDDRGDAIVAWTRGAIVQASFRPAGGSFGVPVSLTAKGDSASLPRVAIDAAGDATVVWYRSKGTGEVVEATTRSAATGSFSNPVVLSNEAEPALYPFVAMNAEGDTAVAWIGSNGADEIVQAAVRPAGGSFDAAVNVSAEGTNAEFPQVALDGRGDPSIVWSSEFVVQYAAGTPSGTFSAPQSLASLSWAPSIAEDTAGDTLISYTNLKNMSAVAVFGLAGGLLSEPREVSAAGATVSPNGVSDEQGLNAAMDGAGDGVVGFTAESGSGSFAEASLLDAAGPVLKSLSIPATATVGVPTTFSVAPSDQLSEPSTASWSFGDASTASGASVTHTFVNPGTYSVSVTATDAVGNSTTKTGEIVVAALAGSTPPPALAFNAAVLSATTVTADRHDRIGLKIACPAGGAECAGTVALTLPATASGLAVAARARVTGTPVAVAIGQAPFSIAPGAGATLSIALPVTVARLLSQHHRLTATALIETEGSSGQSFSRSQRVIVNGRPAPTKRRHGAKKR